MGDLCRVCAIDQVGEDSVNLFKQTNKSRKILNRLKKVTGIELKKKKGMPECVCDGCQERLEQAFEFRLSCKRAQSLLCLSHEQSKKLCETRNALKSASADIELSKRKIVNSSIQIADEDSQLPVHFETVKVECLLPIQWNAAHHFRQNTAVTTLDVNSKILIKQPINYDDEPLISDFEVEPSHPIIEESKDKLTVEAPFYTKNHRDTLEDSFHKFELENVQPKMYSRKKKVIRPQSSQINDDNVVPVMEKPIPKKRGRKKKSEVNSPPNDEKSAKFICELCGQSYSAQHYLLAHMNLHNGVNPYICEICSERFHSERNLKRHLMKHAGLKPYPCRHCDRRFLDYYARMRHERVHTNDRPAKCTYCDKAFTTNYILKNHLLTHTGERAFSCKVCDRSFSQKKHLATHYKSTFHKQNEEKEYEFATTSMEDK